MILYNGVSVFDLMDEPEMVFEWFDQMELNVVEDFIREDFMPFPLAIQYLHIRIQEFGQDMFGNEHNFTD